MIDFFKGKKTYIVMVLGVIFNGLVASGHVDASVLPMVNSILAFLGLGTLRAGISKAE